MLSRTYQTQSEIRKRQINTLKIFNDNVVEIQEGSKYQVLFKAGGKDLILHVCLSRNFPKENPALTISPIVLHPWVNAEGKITSAPGLLNFTVHSDLGRVVQAIIREFERTPPPFAADPCSALSSPSMPARIDVDAMGRVSPNYFHQNISPPVHQSSGSCQSSTFPCLSSMPLEELQFLNESIEKQDDFLQNLSQNMETDKMLDDLIHQIEELTESNLCKRSQLEDLRKDVGERIEEVTKLAFETERLNVVYQNLSDTYSPKNIKNQLLTAAETANVRSDKIAESFLQGEMDVDKFLIEYLQMRTLGQARKTKEEKLTQQLQNLERAGF